MELLHDSPAAPAEAFDILRTNRTFASRIGAKRFLHKTLAKHGYSPEAIARIRYVIAVNEASRFAPVVIGVEHVALCFSDVTVAG